MFAFRGVAGRNADKVASGRDGLSDVLDGGLYSVFTYVTTADGFYRDGSYIQHGKHPYTAGYGDDAIRSLSEMLPWLDGSAWPVTDTNRANVISWLYDSFEPLLWYGTMPEHVRGREIARTYTGYGCGQAVIDAMLRLAQTAPTNDAARINSIVKFIGSVHPSGNLTNWVDFDLIVPAEQLIANTNIISRGELIGHYRFPSMDRVMHLRPGFAFGLSMYSSRIYNYESINGENLHGWHNADGMTYFWTTNDMTQYSDSFWPTVDPYHLPGTTVDQTSLSNTVNQSTTSSQSWVGGTTLSNSFGVTGMALADVNGTLVAKKSWFMFDNEIVCLGAGISDSGATNVHTTVEHRLLSNSNNIFTVDGQAMPTTMGWSSNFANVTWCALTNAGGYYFPGGAAIAARREARTGSWLDINSGGSSSPITRNYLTMILDHGVKPTNATYAYVLLPNASTTAVSQYAANPQTLILTNSPTVQAVRETSMGIVAANFWADGVQTADLITASGKCAVMTRETNGLLEVSVSDPTWANTGTITLTLGRVTTNIFSADSGVSVVQTSPVTQLSVNVNGAHGQSFQARLVVGSLTNSPPFIISQPSSQTVLVSSNATFTVGTSGTAPFAYQWWFNTNTMLAQATNSTLVVTNAQSANAGTYTVTVSNAFGVVTSAVATLTVLNQVVITVLDGAIPGPGPTLAQMTSNAITASDTVTPGAQVLVAELCTRNTATHTVPTNLFWNGQTLNLAISTYYPNATYRSAAIYYLFNPVTDGLPHDITGTINATANQTQWALKYFTLTGVDTTVAPLTNGIAASGVATVWPVADCPNDGFAAVAACWSSSSNILVTINADSGTPYLISSNASPNSVGMGYIKNLAAGTVTFTNFNLVGYSQASAASAAVFTPLSGVGPVITNQPSSLAVLASSNATFTVGASGTGPLNYQWWFNTNTMLVRATNSSLVVANVQSTNAGIYAVTVSNVFGVATSSVAALVVKLPPVINGARVINQTFQINYSGTPLSSYVVQVRTNLLSGTWQTISTNVTDGNGVYSFTDPGSTNKPIRFYRVCP